MPNFVKCLLCTCQMHITTLKYVIVNIVQVSCNSCRKYNTKTVVGLGAHQQGSQAFTVQLFGESYQDLQLSPGLWKVAPGTAPCSLLVCVSWTEDIIVLGLWSAVLLLCKLKQCASGTKVYNLEVRKMYVWEFSGVVKCVCSDQLSICSVLSFETIFSASYLSASLEACWIIEKRGIAKKGQCMYWLIKRRKQVWFMCQNLAVAVAAAEMVAAAATVVVVYWNWVPLVWVVNMAVAPHAFALSCCIDVDR